LTYSRSASPAERCKTKYLHGDAAAGWSVSRVLASSTLWPDDSFSSVPTTGIDEYLASAPAGIRAM
jgi:hypothetical protein